MSDIIVKVSSELAPSLLGGTGSGDQPREAAALLRAVRECGAQLGSATGETGETAQYFPVSGVADGDVPGVLERLRQLAGVEAAYAKPSDEPP